MLYFTVGLPRSGKSTYVNDWLKGGVGRVVVCSDDIRLALHGHRYEPNAESMVFAIKHTMIRAYLNRGLDIIVDGTHTTDTSIRRILELDPHAKPIVVETRAIICIERAVQCGQSDLIPVIRRMSKNMDTLLAEGIENKISRILKEINETACNTP